MSNKIRIAISAALLAAASTANADGARGWTPVSATAAICNELQLPPLSRRCSDPHCLDIDFRDRTVGPTFPTSCRQSA